MLKLHLLRHGRTDWNAERRVQGQSESQLDDTGRAQAAAVRTHIDALNPGAVFCSTAERTRQTAALACAGIALPITYLDTLREIQLGDWEGRLWSEIEKEQPDQVKHFHHHPETFSQPGAETFHALRDRGLGALASIVDSTRSLPADTERNVLVVSHGAIIKAILTSMVGVPAAQLWQELRLDNCSVTVLSVDNEQTYQIESIAGVAFTDTPWGHD